LVPETVDIGVRATLAIDAAVRRTRRTANP
jgi:hypothetical protein